MENLSLQYVVRLRSEALLAFGREKIVPSAVCCCLIVGLPGFWNLNSTVPNRCCRDGVLSK